MARWPNGQLDWPDLSTKCPIRCTRIAATVAASQPLLADGGCFAAPPGGCSAAPPYGGVLLGIGREGKEAALRSSAAASLGGREGSGAAGRGWPAGPGGLLGGGVEGGTPGEAGREKSSRSPKTSQIFWRDPARLGGTLGVLSGGTSVAPCRVYRPFWLATSPTPGWPSMLLPWPGMGLVPENLKPGPPQAEHGLGKPGAEWILGAGINHS